MRTNRRVKRASQDASQQPAAVQENPTLTFLQFDDDGCTEAAARLGLDGAWRLVGLEGVLAISIVTPRQTLI